MEYDFSSMSDEELDNALASAQASVPSQSTQKPFDASAMSDEELDAALASVSAGAPRMTREERIAQNQRAIERAQQHGEEGSGIGEALLEGAKGAGRAVKDIGGGIVGMVSGAARLAGTPVRLVTGWEGLHRLADTIDSSYENFGRDALMSEYGENPDGWGYALGRAGEKVAGVAGSLAALGGVGKAVGAAGTALKAAGHAKTAAAVANTLPLMFGNDAAVRAYDTARANGKSKGESAALAGLNGAIHFLGFKAFENKALNKMLGMPAEMEGLMPKWAGEAAEAGGQSFSSLARGVRNGMIKYTLAERGKGALKAGGIMGLQDMLSDPVMQVAEGASIDDIDFSRMLKAGASGLGEGALMEGALGAASVLKSPSEARKFIADKIFRGKDYKVMGSDGKMHDEPGLLNTSEGRMVLMKQNPDATERVLDIVEHGGTPRPAELDAAFLPPDMTAEELKKFASDWRNDLKPYVDEAWAADAPRQTAAPDAASAEPGRDMLSPEEAQSQQKAANDAAERQKVADRRAAADSMMLDFESWNRLYADGKTDLNFDEWRAAGKPGVIEANLTPKTEEAPTSETRANEEPAQPEQAEVVAPPAGAEARPVESAEAPAEAAAARVVEPPAQPVETAQKPAEAAAEPRVGEDTPKPAEGAEAASRASDATGQNQAIEPVAEKGAEAEAKPGAMSPTQKRNRLAKMQGILGRIDLGKPIDTKVLRYGQNNPNGLKLGDLKMLDDPANEGWQYELGLPKERADELRNAVRTAYEEQRAASPNRKDKANESGQDTYSVSASKALERLAAKPNDLKRLGIAHEQVSAAMEAAKRQGDEQGAKFWEDRLTALNGQIGKLEPNDQAKVAAAVQDMQSEKSAMERKGTQSLETGEGKTIDVAASEEDVAQTNSIKGGGGKGGMLAGNRHLRVDAVNGDELTVTLMDAAGKPRGAAQKMSRAQWEMLGKAAKINDGIDGDPANPQKGDMLRMSKGETETPEARDARFKADENYQKWLKSRKANDAEPLRERYEQEQAKAAKSIARNTLPGVDVEVVDRAFNPETDGGVGKRKSIGGIFTGGPNDYANRSRQGGVDDGPSLKSIGMGEGAQVYGWGLYGSDQRGVAERYAKMGKDPLSLEHVMFDGKLLLVSGIDTIDARVGRLIRDNNWDVKKVEQKLRDRIEKFNKDADEARRLGWGDTAKDIDEMVRAESEELDFVKRNGSKFGKAPDTPAGEHIYEQTFFADRAPGDESHLLKWYSDERPRNLLKNIRNNLSPEQLDAFNRAYNKAYRSGPGGRTQAVFNGDVYKILSDILGSSKFASEFLRDKCDIDGVKYPVDSYRGPIRDGDKAGWNYVSFRDDNIRVDHKWEDGQMRYLRDGEGRVVGTFDRSTNKVTLYRGASAATLVHELGGHATLRFAEQEAERGNRQLLDRINRTIDEAPQVLKDEIRSRYPGVDETALRDEIWAALRERNSPAMEKAIKTLQGKAWYNRAWSAFRDAWKGLLARMGFNRADLSQIDKMSNEEFLKFLDDTMAEGKTLGRLGPGKGEGTRNAKSVNNNERTQLFLDGKHVFHCAEDADVESIVRNGLRIGSNVSYDDNGQAFGQETGVILVFDKSNAAVSHKGYQDDGITGRAAKPIAALIDENAVKLHSADYYNKKAWSAWDKAYNLMERIGEDVNAYMERNPDLFYGKKREVKEARRKKGVLENPLMKEFFDASDEWEEYMDLAEQTPLSRKEIDVEEILRKNGVPIVKVNQSWDEDLDKTVVRLAEPKNATASNPPAGSQWGVRESRAPKPAGYKIMDDVQSKGEKFEEKFIDARAPIRNVQDEIGGVKEVFDPKTGYTDHKRSTDYVAAADKANGRVEYELRDLQNKSDDISRDLAKAALKGQPSAELEADFDLYLQCRHAAERNRTIAERNGVTYDPDYYYGMGKVDRGGTKVGLSENVANDILADMARKYGSLDAFDKAAQKVYEINRADIQRRVEAGRLTVQDANQYLYRWQNYVPLKTDMERLEPDAFNSSTASMRRNEFRKARGRADADIADSPLAASILQAEQGIRGSVKNETLNVLANLVRHAEAEGKPIAEIVEGKDMPQGAGWTFEFGDGTKAVAGGEMKLAGNHPEIILFKEDGKLKAIRFEKGANGRGLAVAKSASGENMGRWGSGMEWVPRFTHWMSAMRTQYSPEFTVSNLLADHLEAYQALVGRYGIKGGTAAFGKMVASEIQNAKDLKNYLRTGMMSRDVGEAVRGGLLTKGGIASEGFEGKEEGIRNRIEDFRRKQKMWREMSAADWAKSGWDNVRDFISFANEMAEYSTRMGIFSALKKQGVPVKDAVKFARDATVNFNRKGTAMPYINGLFMFANASVQGAVRSVQAMTDARGKELVGLLVGVGVAKAVIDHYLGNDDEREKKGGRNARNMSEYDRKHNVGIPIPGTDSQLVPLRFRGPYAAIPYLAQTAANVALGERTPKQGALTLVRELGDQVTDIVGGNGIMNDKGELDGSLIMQSVAPSVIDPFVQLASGKDYKGDDRKARVFDKTTPVSSNGKRSTSEVYKAAARGLNWLTGGNEFRKGLVDVAPEDLQLVTEFIGGGPMRDVHNTVATAKNVAQAAVGGTPERTLSQVPFLRRVVREYPENTARYYDALDGYERDKAEYKKTVDLKRRGAMHREKPYLSAGKGRVDVLAERIKELSHLERGEIKSGQKWVERRTPLAESQKETFRKRRLELQAKVLGILGE